MISRNIDEAAADIDDATTTIEELQAELDVDSRDKLKEVHETLDHASDVLDDEAEGEGEDTDSPLP